MRCGHAGGWRGVAPALALTMLVTTGCSLSSGSSQQEAVAEFVGTPSPRADVTGSLAPAGAAEELLGARFVCDLFGDPELGEVGGLLLDDFGRFLTDVLDDRQGAHLERRVDFGAAPERLGPSCLWQQELDRFVTNQVSLAVTALEVGDVVRGQVGQPVEVDADVVFQWITGGTLEGVETAVSGRPALEVSFDPTEDPPSSIPGDDGLRVWHKGEVNLWWRREAGAMGPLVVVGGEFREREVTAFPGMWINVGVTGELTMYPDEEIKKRLMAVASMTENLLLQAFLTRH